MSRAHIGRIVASAAVVLLFAVVAVLGKAWWDSRLPGTYNVMSYGTHEYGGGPEPPNHAGHDDGTGTSVADLHGASNETPDARFELTALAADIHLSSGRVVHALTFDGKSPGPELRVKQGDLVEVVLRNDDVEDGVTIHWHGIDLPNAEDGVAGVTQNAVLPGASYTYRFRAEQVGTFWYHTHQVSSTEVRRGLFGVIVIEPREEQAEFDLALAAHTFDGIPTLSGDEGGGRQKVAVGTQVRLRLVNTDSFEQTFTVSGTPFRVLAIDGTDLHEPGELESVALPVGAGGRIDVGLHAAAQQRARRDRGYEDGDRIRPEWWAGAGRDSTDGDIRSAHVRHAICDTVRCHVDVRPPLRAEDHPQARILRRPAGTAMGDQRRDLSRRARLRGRGG